jgi:hypothetical protein
MKTKFLLSVLLLSLFALKGNAQCSFVGHTYSGSGYLGWGNGYTLGFATNSSGGSPIIQMDLLTSGDLDVLTPTSGYMINSSPVLSTEGDITSIFVGEQLPIPYGPFSNQYNTIVGYSAGNNMMVGVYNTLSGSYAGTNVNIK